MGGVLQARVGLRAVSLAGEVRVIAILRLGPMPYTVLNYLCSVMPSVHVSLDLSSLSTSRNCRANRINQQGLVSAMNAKGTRFHTLKIEYRCVKISNQSSLRWGQ